MAILLSILVGLTLLGSMLGVFLFWDKGRRSFVLAVRSLWLHKLRAFLSVLGIIIGTAAVISLMALGEGSMHDALEDIKRQGATNIIVRSIKPPDDSSTQRTTMLLTYGLTYSDYDRFTTIGDVVRRVPIRVFPQKIRHLDAQHNGRIVATTPEYAEVNQLELASGRFLTEDDDYQMLNVAVLGANTAESLFPFNDPLGQSVRLGQHFYRIVGVLKPRTPTGGSGGSQAAEVFDDDVYIPLKTCKVRFGESIFIRQRGSFSGEKVQINQVTLTVSDIEKVRPVGDLIKEMLEKSHVNKDWVITVPLDKLEQAEREKNRFQILMAFIGGISLFVGGIGIMNIMLATVTERTREIGIRRALGAKRQDISLQFLIEAVVQTGIGGLIGVITGVSLVWVLPFLWQLVFGERAPARVHVFSIFEALTAAIVVGVAFGWYPAWRAARLDPIEALRHE